MIGCFAFSVLWAFFPFPEFVGQQTENKLKV
jgi:hypothetical protein